MTLDRWKVIATVALVLALIFIANWLLGDTPGCVSGAC